MTVVDVDAHYTAQFEELIEYIEDDVWRAKVASAVTAEAEGTAGFAGVKGFWPKITGPNEGFRSPHVDAEFDLPYTSSDFAKGKDEVTGIMEDLDIDKILLLGNQMITFDQMKGDDARPTIYANAYVDYLLDKLIDPDENIYGTAPVPYQSPSEAVDLIERVADEPGIVALCFVTSKTEPPLGNRRYDPIYAAASKADLPVIFHGGFPGVDNFYLDGFETRLETHTLGFIWANTAQIASIVTQGVPEKFPELDFVFQECGIFWVPMMMYRMDAEYLQLPEQAPLLEKLPSEYMKEFYYGTQPLEHPSKREYFAQIIEMLGGAERLMYASDYPHGDYDVPTAITNMPITEEEKALILGKNAEEVFGI